jgi:hypothetical protein
MQRHLVKYKKCKIIENNNLSDEELYNKSLDKHEIMNKRIECIKCKKTFYSKSNLNKHMKNTCKDSYINIQNIGIQNICVQNIININEIAKHIFVPVLRVCYSTILIVFKINYIKMKY